MNEKLPSVLSQLRRGLEVLYGERLAALFLYGSHARGDQETGSDVDVLVVLKGPVNPGEEIARTGGFLASLCLQNNNVVSCVFLSEERLHSERSPLLLNVRREGVAI